MKRNRSLLRTAVLALLSVGLGATGLGFLGRATAGQTGGSPITLRLKFKPGQVAKYKTTMQMRLIGQSVPLVVQTDQVQQRQVNKTLPDGSGEVTVTVLEQRNSFNGQPSEDQEIAPLTLTYTPRGRVVNPPDTTVGNPIGNPMAGLLSLAGMGQASAYLPAGAVRPGATWTEKLSLPGIAKGGVVTSTFLRLETVGRFRTARIRSVVTLPLDMKTNAQGQPVQNDSEAALRGTGKAVITTDYNLALNEGLFVRIATNGTLDFALKPTTVPKPSGASSKTGSPTPPNGQTLQAVRLKLTMGMNLIS
jgi:hypothetical protein